MHALPILRRLPVLGALAAAATAAALEAQAPAATRAAPASRSYAVTAAESAIRVDGVLDEAAWAAAEPIEVAYEWFPGDNVPAPVRTECRITYDRAALYLGCVAYDPEPSRIRANLTDRDRATGDDHVSLVLDPFNDQRRAFQFRINPLGVQMDATYNELEKVEDFSWDAIWSSAGRLTEEGYVVEAAIPFSSLRFPATADVQTWGIIVGRNWPRGVVHRLRANLTNRNDACLLCQADKMVGLQGIRPGRDVELTPTLTTRRSDVRDDFPGGRLVAGSVDPQVGISGRWGITPNVALNATINPDFSQVEADVAQLGVNERFALLYPEKRPFFLEGADFFQTPTQVVFTRSVIEPMGGVKVSGKAGSSAFGAFATRDRFNSLLFPSNQGTGQAVLNEDVNTAVLRYRRDVGAASALGALYTGRMGENGYANHVGGVDGFVQLSPSEFLRFQAVRSETEYPDSIAGLFGQPTGGFGGNSFLAELTHQSQNWWGNVRLQEVGADFRADAGFVPRTDLRGGAVQAERTFWGGAESWYRRLAFLGYHESLYDTSGQLTDRASGLIGTFNGAMQSTVNLQLAHTRAFFAGETYDLLDVRPAVQVSPTQSATFTLTGRIGEDIDYANARKANLVQLGPGVELRPGRHLNLRLSHTLQRLTTQGDDPVGGGRRIVNAGLTQSRAVYHFNVRTYVRAILQYQDVAYTPELFEIPVPAEQRTLFSQLMFAYKLNPQTVVFAGYTDDRLGMEAISLTPTGRTFFLKLGYNWQP